MIMNKERKSFSKEALLSRVKNTFIEKVNSPSARSPKYSLLDCLMSGIAIFSLKYASLLKFEESFKKDGAVTKNLKNLFAIKDVPSDTQFRERLDVVNYEELQPAFDSLLYDLQRGKVLEDFQYLSGTYLAAIDGTGYFASDSVHCVNCCTQLNQKTGEVKQFLHSLLSVVLIHPDHKSVFPLSLEPINKNDGSSKNDCEINAAKRLLPKLKAAHPFLKLCITLDALYATGPMVELINELGYEYIIVAKDMKYLQKHIGAKNTENLRLKRGSSIKSYHYSKAVPLNSAYPDKLVNYIEYTEFVPDNTKKTNFIIYPNVFSLSNNLQEYKALAIINKEGQVYAHPTAELTTIIYCADFTDNYNSIVKDLKLDCQLSQALSLEFKADKDLYRIWYNMQNKCEEIKQPERISYRYGKGDVLVVYDKSLKESTELLLPKLRLIFRQHKHVGYYNTWITQLEPNKDNIEDLEKGGRSKWHIENQTFNTLKNQGYHFGHNFGHGCKYLSITMCYLMFIAFEIDQIQEHCSYYFKKLKEALRAKIYIWEDIRGGFFNVVFKDWSELYLHVLANNGVVLTNYDTS
jgi:hypothetical protein